MSALDLFRNDEFELSIELHDADGFRVLASGVARALGFRDAYRLVEAIPAAEKGYTTACTPADQRIWYLTEAGFYRALGQRQSARIKSPDVRALVERFQAWVYRDVLPSLRRGAAPTTAPQVDVSTLDRRALALMVVDAEDARAAAEAKVAELEPRAALGDAFIAADGDYSVRDAAQVLTRKTGIDVGAGRLFDHLAAMGWIDSSNRPYQKHVNAGRLTTRPQRYRHPRTNAWTLAQPQVRVTAKGVADLYAVLTADQQMVLLPGHGQDAWARGQ